MRFLVLLALPVLLLLAGCGGSGASTDGKLRGTIAIAGSSTVFPISEAVAEAFIKRHSGVRVNVGSTGTGAGFRAICAGETQIADASRPVKQSELDTCAEEGIELIEIPVAFDALSVVINQRNDWASCLLVDDLATIFGPEAQGTVTNWSQIRQGFPDLGLRLYAPTAASGTFDYFTEAVMGESGAHRGDMDLSTEDDPLIAQGVQGTQGGIGYFGLAYLSQYHNLVSPAAIENPQTGACVVPSRETVEDGSYRPLSRPIFIYVRKDLLDQQPELETFVEFYLQNATTLVPEVGYVALPQTAYQWGLSQLQLRNSGSVFMNVAPGTPIDQVMGRLQ